MPQQHPNTERHHSPPANRHVGCHGYGRQQHQCNRDGQPSEEVELSQDELSHHIAHAREHRPARAFDDWPVWVGLLMSARALFVYPRPRGCSVVCAVAVQC